MSKHITVLMPVYNAEQFVESSIKSVLNQTFSEFEFLIIDDGSTDSTEEIISSFNDSRIIYKKKPHTGLSDSLNNGLSLATYNWVARMDADDLAHPLRLEKQISFMNANPTYKVIASWYGVFENNKIKYTVKSDAKDFNIKKILSLHSPFCHAGVLYNKRIIMIEGYRNLVFEDYDLWLRIMKEINFYIIPEILYFLRFRSDSLSRDNIKEKYKVYYNIQQPYYDESFGEYFGITDKSKVLEKRGWREYFYGKKPAALKFWKKLGFVILLKPRVLFAILTLLLPGKFFIKLKELRIRFRLEYLVSYFSNINKESRETFYKILLNK